MARTVQFYEGVLGLPLVKTQELPNGMGQHFFFDIGNGDCLAFFYFADGAERAPGIAFPESYATPSGDGSMHHIAMRIPPEDVVRCYERLTDAGVELQFIAHHLDRPSGRTLADIADDTYAASVYFKDPDGIVLEFCAWMPAWSRVVREHEPSTNNRVAAPI